MVPARAAPKPDSLPFTQPAVDQAPLSHRPLRASPHRTRQTSPFLQLVKRSLVSMARPAEGAALTLPGGKRRRSGQRPRPGRLQRERGDDGGCKQRRRCRYREPGPAALLPSLALSLSLRPSSGAPTDPPPPSALECWKGSRVPGAAPGELARWAPSGKGMQESKKPLS